MTSTQARILVLGGSGKTGRLLIAEALRRGFSVTVLVRNPASLPEKTGLKIVQGSPAAAEDVLRAVQATNDLPSVIISTLGQTRQSGNPWSAPTSPPKFMAEAIQNCVTVAKQNDIPKLIVMSMFGAGDSMKNLNFLMRFVINNSNMAQTLEDHNLVDQIVKGSGLKYVLVRPCMLAGDNDGSMNDLGNGGENAPFFPSVSAVSVASFLLDAAESNQWDGRSPVISS